jgi:hypothetical protein
MPAPTHYALYLLYAPAGGEPPAEHVACERRFDSATNLYEMGRYTDAASQFMEAAAALPAAPDHFHAMTFATNRLLAYKNAASAWAMAGTPEAIAAALTPLVESAPGCADGLRSLLANPPASMLR